VCVMKLVSIYQNRSDLLPPSLLRLCSCCSREIISPVLARAPDAKRPAFALYLADGGWFMAYEGRPVTFRRKRYFILPLLRELLANHRRHFDLCSLIELFGGGCNPGVRCATGVAIASGLSVHEVGRGRRRRPHRRYDGHIEELREKCSDARDLLELAKRNNDLGAVERWSQAIDATVQAIRACGISARDLQGESDAKRVVDRIRKALGYFIVEVLSHDHEDLARHLSANIEIDADGACYGWHLEDAPDWVTSPPMAK